MLAHWAPTTVQHIAQVGSEHESHSILLHTVAGKATATMAARPSNINGLAKWVTSQSGVVWQWGDSGLQILDRVLSKPLRWSL